MLKENKLINLFYPKNTYTNMSKSNIMAYVCQSFVHVFQVGLLHLISLQNFSSVPFVFCWFFAWIALGDVDWHFSLILLTKVNAIEGRAASCTWIYQHNQSIHMNDGVTDTLLFASLQHKTSVHRSCMPNHIKLKIIV